MYVKWTLMSDNHGRQSLFLAAQKLKFRTHNIIYPVKWVLSSSNEYAIVKCKANIQDNNDFLIIFHNRVEFLCILIQKINWQYLDYSTDLFYQFVLNETFFITYRLTLCRFYNGDFRWWSNSCD